jgi:hypothetical protein
MGTFAAIEFAEINGGIASPAATNLHFTKLFTSENISQITNGNVSAWDSSPLVNWITQDGTFQIQDPEGFSSQGNAMYVWIQVWGFNNPSFASFDYAVLPSAPGSQLVQAFPVPNYTLVVGGISTEGWQYKIFNHGLCTKNNTLSTIHCGLAGVEASRQHVVLVTFSLDVGPELCCASLGINPADLNITSMTRVLNELASMIDK